MPRQIIGLEDIRHLETHLHRTGRRHANTASFSLRRRQMIARHQMEFHLALFQIDEFRAFMRHGQTNGIGVEGTRQHQILSKDFKEEPHLSLLTAMRPSPGNKGPIWP